MQSGSVYGFAFRRVAAPGPYLASTRRGKVPKLVLGLGVGAALLFGSTEGADDFFVWACETEPVPESRCIHRPSHVAYIQPGFGIADFHLDLTREHPGPDHETRRRKESATCEEDQHPVRGVIRDHSLRT
jgi:hypothetical protein